MDVSLISIVPSAGMCSSKNQELIDETFQFMLKEARDQDVYIFFAFLAANKYTRRQLLQVVLDNYDDVSCSAKYRLETMKT